MEKQADLFATEMIAIEGQAGDTVEGYERLAEKMLKKHHGHKETRPCEKSVLNMDGLQKRYVFDDGSSTDWI